MKLTGSITKVTHKNGTEIVFKTAQALQHGQPDELYSLEGTVVDVVIEGAQATTETGDLSALEAGVDNTGAED